MAAGYVTFFLPGAYWLEIRVKIKYVAAIPAV
jgi:hypothetical protein